MKKEELRKKCLEIRKNLPFKEADAQMLFSEPSYKNAKTVFCYVSAKNEIGTHSVIEKMILDGKNVCVPFCVDGTGNMICVKIESLSELKEGFFGIPEPKNPVPFNKRIIDLVIMPGVAFSPEGARLGYGKGYYDRFLADITPFKIGFCHKELLTDIKPEPHDIKADKVMAF